jgi:hypothetical protein
MLPRRHLIVIPNKRSLRPNNRAFGSLPYHVRLGI